MLAHNHSHEIKNPGPFQIPSGLRTILIAFAVIGTACFVGGLATDSKRAWAGFVLNHFYFMSLAMGGIFFAALQWLTGAMWSAPVRRVSEAATAYLPIAALTFVILYFGLHSVYPWTHPEIVKGDIILEGKSGYLSTGFFMIRNLIALALWIFFAKKIVGNSIAQDAKADVSFTLKNKVLAPGFMIIFALTYTMASFDQMMSLDPHWFSTMFGVYCFAGLFYQILAFTAIVVVYLKRKGALEGIVNGEHLHDLGKFMFAFTIFWAYIGFCQFMLIWYANMPEETVYYIHRFHGQWLYVSIFLLLGKFMVPFFVLIPRDAKRSESVLMGVGIFMMIAQWIDIMWIVQPEFYAEGPRLGWVEIGTTLGFLGVFGLMVAKFLGRHNVLAIHDPKLEEALFHHHQ